MSATTRRHAGGGCEHRIKTCRARHGPILWNGRDIALRLVAEGYMVYGAARRIERMGDIQATGGKVVAINVTDDASMIDCIDRMIQQQGPIDVLINSAGYEQFGALEDVPIAEGRRQMETATWLHLHS